MRIKKKYAVLMLAALLSISATACGTTGNSREEQEEPATEAVTAAETEAAAEIETEAVTEPETEAAAEAVTEQTPEPQSSILIAYFTAAENSGVDAEASASYSDVDGEAKGRMQALAEMIQAETGGDLFSIRTEVVYPADGGELIDYAADEQDENARPELTSHIENLDSYDTVFVGFPNWWGDMPQAMYSFFDEYDFSGKTIIPFNSHNGSRFSGTIDTIQELEPDAEVVTDGFTINEREVPDAAGEIADWLLEIGISGESAGEEG